MTDTCTSKKKFYGLLSSNAWCLPYTSVTQFLQINIFMWLLGVIDTACSFWTRKQL